ncbi:MAG TPA: tetratricopeptide repeat protein [Pirellulaceae bacterium]|nr:tetratricopeptide repeat protein [Pirellulaceae bacterium]
MARRFLPLFCVGAACLLSTGCSWTGNKGSTRWNWFGHAKQDAERLVSVARLSERHGKPDEARAGYHKAIEVDPKNQTAYHRLGVMATRDGQLDDALKYFEQASAAGKPNPDLLSDLGYTLYLKHELARADTKLREALKMAPEHRAARNNLGLVLGEQKRFDEALAEFLKGGSEAEAYANLAYVQSQAGMLGDAEKNYHKALERDANLRQATEALLQLADAKAKAVGEPGLPPAPTSRPQYTSTSGGLPTSQFQSQSAVASGYSSGGAARTVGTTDGYQGSPAAINGGAPAPTSNGATIQAGYSVPVGMPGGQSPRSGLNASGTNANVGDLPRPGAASGAFTPPTAPGATSGGQFSTPSNTAQGVPTAPTFSMPHGVPLR